MALAQGSKKLEFPPFTLDPDGQRLWRGKRPVDLRPKPWQLLCYLAERPQQLVTKDDLLDAVWGDVEVTDASLTVAIAELRRALGDDARKPRFIETVHRRGLRFVARLREQRAPAELRGPGPGPLVGREKELGRLEESLGRARAGQRQVVFVTGEPGIGKTSLIRGFLQRRTEDPASEPLWVARGQCAEHYGEGEAYLPALELLERLAHEAGSEPVRGALERFAPSWLPQLPGLQRREPAAKLPPRVATPRSMLREFCLVVEALSEKRPLVLWLEDMQWSDLASVDLLAALARRSAPARLLVLATYRPVDAAMHAHPIRALKASLLQHGACDELGLELLDESGVLEYLRSRFSAEPEPALASLVLEQTAGNPLFVVTLANHLVAGGQVEQKGELLTLATSPETLRAESPGSLGSLVEAQLLGMSEEDVGVLEAASVVGESFAAQAVAGALGVEVEAAEKILGRLAEWERFIEPAGAARWPDGSVGERYGFRHAVFRSVLYGRTTAGRRQRLHRRLAERLEAGFAGHAELPVAELAMHHERGGDAERAILFLVRAAASVRRRFAEREAVGYLERALELLARLPDSDERARRELELRLLLARAVLVAVSYSASGYEVNLDRARELAVRLGDSSGLAVVLSYQARVEFLRGRFQAMQALAEQQLALDPGPDRVLASQAHLELGNASLFQGLLDRAEQEHARVRSQLEGVALREPSARLGHDPAMLAMAFSGWTAWLQGGPDEARRRAETSQARAEAVGDPFAAAVALALSSVVEMLRGDLGKVCALASQVADNREEYGIGLPYAIPYATQGWLLARTEGPDSAIRLIRRGISATREARTLLGSTLLYGTLAEVELERGRAREGLAAVEDALAFAEKSGERFFEAELHRLKGELLRLQGEGARAEACFQTALDVARRQGTRSLELRAATSLARLWSGSGRNDESRALLAPLYAGFSEGFDTRDLQDAKALLDER